MITKTPPLDYSHVTQVSSKISNISTGSILSDTLCQYHESEAWKGIEEKTIKNKTR